MGKIETKHLFRDVLYYGRTAP